MSNTSSTTKRKSNRVFQWIKERPLLLFIKDKCERLKKWSIIKRTSPMTPEIRKNKEKLNQVSDHWKLHDLLRKIDFKEEITEPTASFMKYGISLRILITQMRRVKWCFHFTRNNPNHTKRFYFRLKEIVGLDKWQLVCPEVRQAWEDASNRFDMQYGLVRAWAMTPWVLEPFKPEIPNDKPPEWMIPLIDGINDQTKKVEALTNMLNKTPKDLQDKLDAMNQATQEAQKAAEDALKTLNAYHAISNAKQSKEEERKP